MVTITCGELMGVIGAEGWMRKELVEQNVSAATSVLDAAGIDRNG